MADEEFEAPTELGLFSLATLKSDKALNAVATDAEGASSIAKRAVDGAEMMQAIRKGSKAMEVTQKVLDALEQAEKAEEERIKRSVSSTLCRNETDGRRKAPIGGQDESDDEARTKQDENMLDAMYADYLSKKDSESTKEKAAKARVESRVGMNAAVRDGDALDDFSAYPDAVRKLLAWLLMLDNELRTAKRATVRKRPRGDLRGIASCSLKMHGKLK